MTTTRDEGGPAAGVSGVSGEAGEDGSSSSATPAVPCGLLGASGKRQGLSFLENEARCVLSLGIFYKLTR